MTLGAGPQHARAYALNERHGLLVAQRTHGSPRVDLRLPTALRLPDVADTGDDALVEQCVADRSLLVGGAQPSEEARGVELVGQDVGPQRGKPLIEAPATRGQQ